MKTGSLVIAEHVVRWSKTLLVELLSSHGKSLKPLVPHLMASISALEKASDEVVKMKNEPQEEDGG
jgi:hypothetical protein